MKDLDLVNVYRFVSDEISDICFRSQLLKPFKFIRIVFKFDKDIYFIRVRFEIVKDRFPGACYPLNYYDMFLKHFVRNPLI